MEDPLTTAEIIWNVQTVHDTESVNQNLNTYKKYIIYAAEIRY